MPGVSQAPARQPPAIMDHPRERRMSSLAGRSAGSMVDSLGDLVSPKIEADEGAPCDRGDEARSCSLLLFTCSV